MYDGASQDVAGGTRVGETCVKSQDCMMDTMYQVSGVRMWLEVGDTEDSMVDAMYKELGKTDDCMMDAMCQEPGYGWR